MKYSSCFRQREADSGLLYSWNRWPEITAVHSFWRWFLSASALLRWRGPGNPRIASFGCACIILTLPSESMWSTDRAANMFRRRYPHSTSSFATTARARFTTLTRDYSISYRI